MQLQSLYEAQVVPDVLASAVLKYLLAGDANQFELADLAEVCMHVCMYVCMIVHVAGGELADGAFVCVWVYTHVLI